MAPEPVVLEIEMPPVPAVAVRLGVVRAPVVVIELAALPFKLIDVLPVSAAVAMLPLVAVKPTVVPPSALTRLMALLPAAAVPVNDSAPRPALAAEFVMTPADAVNVVPAAREPSDRAVTPLVRFTVFVAAVLVSDRAEMALAAVFKFAVAPPPFSAIVNPVVAVKAPVLD